MVPVFGFVDERGIERRRSIITAAEGVYAAAYHCALHDHSRMADPQRARIEQKEETRETRRREKTAKHLDLLLPVHGRPVPAVGLVIRMFLCATVGRRMILGRSHRALVLFVHGSFKNPEADRQGRGENQPTGVGS
jgi:hypothetical protein